MAITKDCVKLREKRLKDGNVSLYLDMYDKGKRSYEFLKLYLVPEVSRAAREKNRDTRRMAEAIRSKRMLEIIEGRYDFETSSKIKLLDYFDEMVEVKKRTESISTVKIWDSCRKIIAKYERNSNMLLSDVTAKWIRGFEDYMRDSKESKLSNNTIYIYMSKLRACLNKAYREGMITRNPVMQVKCGKTDDVKREYLTKEEIHELSKTKCDNEEIKRAFLFSCLTGLRKSDIMKMTWDEISIEGDFMRITFKQKKTHGQEYLDIAKEAAGIIGDPAGKSGLVFSICSSAATITAILQRWVKKAGINKHITFHCARHTFAIMMLDLGTDIYTVSKLLGHRELDTTQIYARVLDKNKRKAVSSIPNILGSADEHSASPCEQPVG